MSAFFWRAFLAQIRRPPIHLAFVREVVDAGWGSLPLVAILALFSGLSLVVHGYEAFTRFGGEGLLGTFAAVGGVRELYPVICAVVCGARIGANLAASLANMKISEQIEALEVMAVDPMKQLVAPRLWAGLFAMPMLVVVADALGLLASYVGAVHQLGLDSGVFLVQLRENVGLFDIGAGVLKGLTMGWVVAIVACYEGYTVAKSEGARGVGSATNRAIVRACVACIVLNLALSAVLYGEP